MKKTKLVISLTIVGLTIAHQNFFSKSKVTPESVISSKEVLAETMDYLIYEISEAETNGEEVGVFWEKESQESCREVRQAFYSWQNKPNENLQAKVEGFKKVFNLIGLHTSRVQRLGNKIENKQNPINLSGQEDYAIPCGHNVNLMFQVSDEYRKHTNAEKDVFFELVKLNYNHISHVESFKGIGIGLELLQRGTAKGILSERDEHELNSLIRKSKVLNFEYQQELLDFQAKKVEQSQLMAIISYYDQERVLLRTKVRLYLEQIVQVAKSERTAQL